MTLAPTFLFRPETTMNDTISTYITEYKRDHQHPVNKALHMVGIPTILLSFPVAIVSLKLGAALFVGGWILQFAGHAFEGKKPTFFRDPRFLLVGAAWYLKRAFAWLTGREMT